MSDLQPKSEGEIFPERTTTSFMLDQHFTECSMPASNANALAHELIQEKLSVPQQAFVIDKSGFREEFVARRFLTTDIVKHPESQALRYALATSRGENKSPRLIAFFNGDLAVQVAAFETRKDDRCNFVQLGQEFQDENYIAYTTDHSRLEYIHAIKALLTDKYGAEELGLLTDFTLREIDLIQQEPLDSERLAGIQRKMREQIERARTTKPIHIHLANGEDIPAQGMLETTFPDWDLSIPLSDGREISLVALQHCAPRSKLGSLMLKGKLRTIGQGNIILAAKTGDDIAVPLYEFSEHGTAVLDTSGKPITRDEAATLQRLVENADDSNVWCIEKELDFAKSDYSREEVIVHLHSLLEKAEENKDTAEASISTLMEIGILARQDPKRAAHKLMALKEKEESREDSEKKAQQKLVDSHIQAAGHLATALRMLDPEYPYDLAPSNPNPFRRYFTSADPYSPDVQSLCKEFHEKQYGTIDLTAKFEDIFRSTGESVFIHRRKLTKLIRVAELTKELQDTRTNPRHAHVAFAQQPSVQEKITTELGEHQPKLDALKDRLAELSEESSGVAHGIYQEYPTSTGTTNLDVSAEVGYKNGTYKLRLYLTPDGQQGKKEPLTRFDGEISRVFPNNIDDDEIDELLDLLKVINT